MLIDTHAHLNDERYEDELEDMIASMESDNLNSILCVGYDADSSMKAFEIAQKHKNIFAAVGVHPNETGRVAEGDYDKIFDLCKQEKTVAYGEIGLDYYYPDTDRKIQNRELQRQLENADAAKLPVIFHVRDAYEDIDKMLKQNSARLSSGAVMHCFSGSAETAKKYADLGFYISFSGSITFKNAVKFPEIIRSVPLRQLLIETDCPYLTPVPFRGKLNYPKYVKFQAEKLSEILQISVREIEDLTSANARRLFAKMSLISKDKL